MEVSFRRPRNEVLLVSSAFLIRKFGRVVIANIFQGGLPSGASER